MTDVAKRDVPARRRLFEGGPLAIWRDEMEEMLENWFGSDALTSGGQPRLDLSETDAEVEVQTDVPGFEPNEIDIEVRDDRLTIRGQHSEEKESEADAKKGNGRKYHRVERRSGSFSRSIWLPCGVKADAVEAVLKDGVLTVTLPKLEDAKACKVKVQG